MPGAAPAPSSPASRHAATKADRTIAIVSFSVGFTRLPVREGVGILRRL